MGSRQRFETPHSRVPSAMIGQYTLKPDTHSNRDTGLYYADHASQTMYVRWSGILSHGFHVANGVRQGGILSPYLFNVLMITF